MGFGERRRRSLLPPRPPNFRFLHPVPARSRLRWGQTETFGSPRSMATRSARLRPTAPSPNSRGMAFREASLLGRMGRCGSPRSATIKSGASRPGLFGTEFTIPTAGAFAHQITTGPDGALWFAEAGADKIGRVTTAGQFSEFSTPTAGGAPFGIAAAPDGHAWFTQIPSNKFGLITTTTSPTITE